MSIRFPIASLPEHCRGRTTEFAAAVAARATRDGSDYVIDSAVWSELTRADRSRRWTPVPAPAGLGELVAQRDAVCDGCEWMRRAGPQRYCDHPRRACAKLFPASRAERCPLARWPALDTKTMNPPTSDLFRARLEIRKASHQLRVQQAQQRVTLLEANLAGARQRHAIALGQLKEVSDLLAEPPATAPAAPTPVETAPEALPAEAPAPATNPPNT